MGGPEPNREGGRQGVCPLRYQPTAGPPQKGSPWWWVGSPRGFWRGAGETATTPWEGLPPQHPTLQGRKIANLLEQMRPGSPQPAAPAWPSTIYRCLAQNDLLLGISQVIPLVQVVQCLWGFRRCLETSGFRHRTPFRGTLAPESPQVNQWLIGQKRPETHKNPSSNGQNPPKTPVLTCFGQELREFCSIFQPAI